MQPFEPRPHSTPVPDGRREDVPAAEAAAGALLSWDWWLPEERESCQRIALGIATGDDSPDRAWLAQLHQEAAAVRRLRLWRELTVDVGET